MSEPKTAAGRALATWSVEVEVMLDPHLPQNGMGQKIRANVLAIEAEAQAPLAAIVALARAREAAVKALAEHDQTWSAIVSRSAEDRWWAVRDALDAEQAAAVAALRKALGEVAG